MVHIAVAFRQSDLEIFADILGTECVIVGDITCGSGDGQVVRPQLEHRAEAELAAQVRELFESFERNVGYDSIAGFANNFYECSVAPLCAFINTLDGLISDLSRSQGVVEVWFPSKYLIASRFSAFFMAEHESQGKHLYSREAAFLPYLLDVCKRYKATVKFKRVRIGMGSVLQRASRVVGVLAWRFCHGMAAVFRSSKMPMKVFVPIDLVAVTRSRGQTEFLRPFLAASGLVSVVVAAETALGGRTNGKLVESVSSHQSAIIGALLGYSFSDLLVNYVRALLLMATKQSARLQTNGIELNLDQALTEVLVMWPDLVAYRKALHDVVRQLGTPRSLIFLTTEQKSPQAHADAWVAAQCGLKCVQVMQCDQHARPLPFPVFGDFFLADNAINAMSFAHMWGNCSDKVRYIGSLKACITEKKGVDQLRPQRTRLCFFAQVDNFEGNSEILRELRNIREKNQFDIIVKLHPRDRVRRYYEFNDFTFLTEGAKEKDEFFDEFEFAVSFPSGVILDLIFRNKPFLLLCLDKWDANSYSYFQEGYVGNILSVDCLSTSFSNLERLSAEYLLYRQRFLEKSGIISDVHQIKVELFKLPPIGAKTKNSTQPDK
jgi:hypothetical protein